MTRALTTVFSRFQMCFAVTAILLLSLTSQADTAPKPTQPTAKPTNARVAPNLDLEKLKTQSYSIILDRPTETPAQLSGLEFPHTTLKLDWNPADPTSKPKAIVECAFLSVEHTLVWGNLQIKNKYKDRPTRFLVPVPLEKELTEVFIQSVDAFGIPKSEKIFIRVRWNLSKHYISAGLGVSHIIYRETQSGSLTMNALTAKASYWYNITRARLLFGASGYITALPLTSTNKSVTARFVGVNLRAGYSFNSPNSPWLFSLSGGWYYTTMLVSPSVLGFRDMNGIQLYPTLFRRFSDISEAFVYIKFSPMLDGFKFSNIQENREIAAGGAYSRNITKSLKGSLYVDFSTFMLKITSRNISSHSLTVGTGLIF